MNTLEQQINYDLLFVDYDFANEEDLVNSGLEETMVGAYNEIRETLKSNKKIPDLRTAAFVTAINKVAESYYALGIFP